MILQDFLSGKRSIKLQNDLTIYACLVIFSLSSTWFKDFLPRALNEIVLAYSLLLIGIGLCDRLNNNKAIKSLGLCSFGIYLIHPLSMNVVKILIARIAPQLTTQVTIVSMLFFSLSSFFLSWWAVSILIKNEWSARYMFGATSKRNTQLMAYSENK
jgi:peptidoglycan/LPS O-acetylase OafA/YrhL